MANAISYTGVYSFPYPLGTDDISSGAARLQALAERMEAVLVDAGIEIGTYDVLKTSTVFAGDITGLYNALQIGANTITSVELADNSVDSAAIVAGAVTTVKLDVVDLPAGSTATTQTQLDSSTKVATTSYVDTAAFNFTLGAVPPLSITNAMLAGSITYAKLILTNSIVNADVATGAAIDKTKISGTAVTIADTGTVTSTMLLDGTILNADVNASAAIAYSKLNLGTSIVNADISATAAIVDTKLATIGTAGKVSNTATTATDANTASAIVARDASGNFTAGMITANVTGALTGNASTVTTNANLTGDVTSVGNATSIASGVIVNADVNASAAISYSKLNLGTSIVNADVSASAAIAYSKLALTGAILDADLAGSIAPAKITGTAVVTADSRLSDARTPTAHASTHIPGGTDVLNFSAFSGQGSSLPGSLTLYPAGSLFAVGAAAPYLIYRSNGTSWDQLGASAITTSDTAPASPQAGDLWYQSSTGKQFIYYDSFWVEMGNNTNASVASHASNHIRGGSDIIDGDRVTIDYVPTNYTRNSAATGAGDVTDLTAHLAGIDMILPAGMLMPYAGSTEPTGWVFCYGQTVNSVSNTAYARLWTAIGTTYGGASASSFILPDLRGRTLAGKDNMGGTAASRVTSGGSGITGTTLGASGGLETHTLTTAQLAAHTHTIQGTYPSTPWINGLFASTDASGGAYYQTTSSTGGGGAHNNTQPTIITNYLIKL